MVDINTARQLETLGGRLSFHNLTAAAAFEEASTSPFPTKDVASTSPYANLLLTQAQYEKVMKKILDEFFPMCLEQYRISDKEKHALSQAQIDQLTRELETLDGLLNTPFKKPSEKTLELMPDCAASIKLIGSKGVDFKVDAIVKDEAGLKVPDPDRIKYPVIVPIEQSVHQLYNGCWVIAKGLTFYRYFNGGPKKPGFSAGCGSLVFSRDDTPFAGGPAVDDDAVFMALDEL